MERCLIIKLSKGNLIYLAVFYLLITWGCTFYLWIRNIDDLSSWSIIITLHLVFIFALSVIWTYRLKFTHEFIESSSIIGTKKLFYNEISFTCGVRLSNKQDPGILYFYSKKNKCNITVNGKLFSHNTLKRIRKYLEHQTSWSSNLSKDKSYREYINMQKTLKKQLCILFDTYSYICLFVFTCYLVYLFLEFLKCNK